MELRLEDITPETLYEVSAGWEEDRLENLIRRNVQDLGEELRQARRVQSDLEVRAKMRAIKLHHEHGFSKKEIAQLLGLEVKEINRWLR